MVTSWTNTGNLVSALVFLYFSGVKGFITSPPQNTAIKVGSQTHLNCSGNNGVPGWTFGEQGNSIPLIALGSFCNVESNYASSYRGEPQGSNTCNLIILNSSLQESGVYACLDNDLASQYAVLTVLSFSGTPVVNNGSEVVEGDQLRETCTVEYGTSISVPVVPILIWTISGINITNAETTKTNNSISSSLTFVTTRDGIPSYDCTAHFLPPASTSNFASNAPCNIYIGATYPITGVYYYPGNITITGGSCVNEPEQKNLTCVADANPSAVYKWLSHANNITTNGSVLTITIDGLYECIATNCIRNQTHSDTKTNNATKCHPPSNAKIVATSAGLIACEAKELTCHSDANPPPIYIWVDLTSGNVTNEEKIIAECGVNYTCYASNSIRNVTYVNSSTFYEDPIKNITCKFPRATNMDISGQFCKEDYCECECNSTIIHCSVDAYPEPLYEWLIPDGSRVQGQTVEATINGVFVCRSYTLIDGLYLMEAYKSINISGCYYSPITTKENVLQCNCSSSEIAAIVLGVLLAISIAVNIFSFVLFYRKGAVKKNDSNEPEMTQPSSHSQEPHYQDPSHEIWAKPEYEELHH